MVVVNPVHVAVALRWAPEECDAPYLVARGRGEDARAIRAAALTVGIPVVRDVALARGLVQYDVGEEVPAGALPRRGRRAAARAGPAGVRAVTSRLRRALATLQRHRELVLPCLVAAILGAIIVPLPGVAARPRLALNLAAAARCWWRRFARRTR